ncbi:hypothetical protein [Evansella halocellulosilytica]|uniref:hypothetical protein n=1 Tax=Evansella halocellulosilytica TaxID=2011013 RepID=UPI000BB6AE57|nr:hypothetical protein [Evansella halocellulosilytica]
MVVLSYLSIVSLYVLFLGALIPVSIHFEGGALSIIKKCFQFIIGRIHIALLFIVLIWASMYLSLAFPAAIIFFSGSVLS